MKKHVSLLVCFTAALISGCANRLKSEYRAPEVDYPTHWYQEEAAPAYEPFSWCGFNDSQLDSWLGQVFTNNSNLELAILRVYRARLEADRVTIASTPGLKGSLAVDARKPLDSSSQWAKGSAGSLTTGYELDLWGKIAFQHDGAAWSVRASTEDLHAARLVLLADASTNYWQIALVNQQITVQQHSIAYAQETLRQGNSRYRAGSVSSLDVADAKQSLLAQEARLLSLQRDRLLLLNQQAVLLGTAPGNPVVEPLTLPTGALPVVNGHIPASVLRNRPDIRAKEARVHEALSTLDIKRVHYYPEFSLTGALGTSSRSLLSFIQNPVGTLGASLTLPFLEWQQRGNEIKIARNDYEQRLLAFKQSLYQAMSDIEDALSLRDQLLAQEGKLVESYELALQSERINEVRYREGAVRISFWLEAQEKRRQAALVLNDNRYNQLKNLARIYLEFGGSAHFP